MLGLLTLLAALPPASLAAQDAPLNAGALFLLLPVGAHPAAMGQAGTALEGRGDAAFWNPAGLATLPASEFGLHTASLAAGRAHVVTAYFPSPRIGVVGGAVYLVDYGDLESTDSAGHTVARVSPRNLEFLASYATGVAGPLVLGVSYKLVEFRVDCSGDCRDFPSERGVTHALDVGGQVTLGQAQDLRIGFALRNVGFPLQVENRAQADPLPARLVLGALYRLPFHPGNGPDGAGRVDLQVAADVHRPWDGDGPSEMRLGLDVGYEGLLRLRGGYAFVPDGLSGPSVGVGVTSGSIGVDLARMFTSGSDLVVPNPTFFSFRVVF
ncbi:MAG TPA: PorV/PorQ family protein [Gemmatimonadales bacterium]|nr:PorV/PorQ family protein [Gemmatimonadales bacterium]